MNSRERLRYAAAVSFYRWKRKWEWYFGTEARFAREIAENRLPYRCFFHETPLLRQLAQVDMWMQHNKVKNLALAIQPMNGLLLKPGETFSYWKQVGKPTRRKGYVEGMLLHKGTVRSGVGGGLCQLSNLLYWMTLHTPLTVTERHRHSYDVFPDSGRTQPFGSGATCFYNYIDLQIRNDTQEVYQLSLQLTPTHLQGEWLSTSPNRYVYEIYEKNHWITSEYRVGYIRNNEIRRRILHGNGEMIGDEFVSENHARMMYEPLLPESGEIQNGL